MHEPSNSGLDGKLFNSSMFEIPADLVDSAWLEHGSFAFWLIEELRPRVLVELGTHNGFSYLAFCQNISRLRLDSKCYAIDSWEGDAHTGTYSSEVLVNLRDLHDQKYSAFSTLMPMLFDDGLQHFEEKSIDLLHIDGWHTYEAVKHDFESWKVKLSDRAVVLFHDINAKQKDFGVHKFWTEIKSEYPSFEFDHGYGLGVLLLGPKVPARLQVLVDSSEIVSFRKVFSLLGRGILNSWHKIELREALRAEFQLATHEKQRLETEKQRLETEKQRLETEKQRLETGITLEVTKALQLENRIKLLESSLSFKITSPLRSLHRIFVKKS